jgi:hypothetical protein
MRFIVYFEFCPEDTDKALALFDKNSEMRAKDPNALPKIVFPAQYIDNGKGFVIVEVTDPDQWARGYVSGIPDIKWKTVACGDFSKWRETYEKSK